MIKDARRGSRTLTHLRGGDFKSPVSTIPPSEQYGNDEINPFYVNCQAKDAQKLTPKKIDFFTCN